jgi:hypothetical protein
MLLFLVRTHIRVGGRTLLSVVRTYAKVGGRMLLSCSANVRSCLLKQTYVGEPLDVR